MIDLPAQKDELGYLALVLHAHLPYVRHLEKDLLEERWLFEAINESYIPLLQTFEQLSLEGVEFCLTFSLSPTLLSMLDDELILKRYADHLDKLIELAGKETARTRRDPKMNRLAVMYFKKFLNIRSYMQGIGYKLIPQFKTLAEHGYLELITTAATHGYMPAMETEEAIRAQWDTGLQLFEQHFNAKPKGVWVPECGYTPGVDRILREYGISYFFCDSHAVIPAGETPRGLSYSPVTTRYGVNAFARDQEAASQVWSSKVGYPGDYDYREYYRDIGFDLPLSYIQSYIHPAGIRVHTGLKYYRVTGPTDHKETYDIKTAIDKAAVHAGHFLDRCGQRIEEDAGIHRANKPLIVAPFDAELFGHWWYEGPQFIDFLCRKIHFDYPSMKLTTPSQYLEENNNHPTAELPLSSWGRNGYSEVWINEDNAWIYRHLHKAEERMAELAKKFDAPTALEERALNMAAKQLLLAQSSDWSFIMDNKTMTDYAVRRFKEHAGIFHQLYEKLMKECLEAEWIDSLELNYPIFPTISYRVYLPADEHTVAVTLEQDNTGSKRKILMLSWEYPPRVIGGLSRAVYDLSRALARQGEEVHVFTSHVEGYPAFEQMEGVYVHRISCYRDIDHENFMDWVFQFNLTLLNYYDSLVKQGFHVNVVHAHDWLVSLAARRLKERYHLPLIATIHATEFGRNQGIFTELQKRIHAEEGLLTREAGLVISCSHYMAKEISRLFELPREKVWVIPNGVDPQKVKQPTPWFDRSQYALTNEKIILFVGRLVPEKGAQLLLEAFPEVLAFHPEAKLIIAGKGPMDTILQKLANELGLGQKVLFTGFIEDQTRNGLLQHATLAAYPSLYEPFGIVALEAMAAQTPVIVSDTGGLGEIVQHGENGLSIYSGNVSSLRDQLIYALNHPEHLDSMVQRASEMIATQYNWQDLASITRAAYDSLTMNLPFTKETI
nr:1,4-alpha-glucan branching protein domain-containing protein [Ammoniphilus resinae]